MFRFTAEAGKAGCELAEIGSWPETSASSVRSIVRPRYYMHACNGTGLVEVEEGLELLGEAPLARKLSKPHAT